MYTYIPTNKLWHIERVDEGIYYHTMFWSSNQYIQPFVIRSLHPPKCDQEHNPYALVLALIPLLTIFGNALVILAVRKDKSLQTVTNLLIVSLASADLLVALCVMFFAVYFEVRRLKSESEFLKTIIMWILCFSVELFHLGSGSDPVQLVHWRRCGLFHSIHSEFVGHLHRQVP